MFIKTIEGKTIILNNITKSSTIKDIKNEIAIKINQHPKNLILMWGGKIFDDTHPEYLNIILGKEYAPTLKIISN